MRTLIISAALTALCLTAVAARSEVREYSRIITVNDYTYEIEVGGFRDPVNETIIIENLGDEPLVNPRITVDGRFDWFDVEAMAHEATRGCTTDEEKALAIYEFVRVNFHHTGSTGDRETHNPVVALNVYGYSNCAYHSTVFTALCQAAGIPARVWEVWHHTITEAFYNNAWHMLDTDIGLYYLMDDNRTVASVEQLWEDQKASGGVAENVHLTKYSGRNRAAPLVFVSEDGARADTSQDGKRIRGYRYYHGPEHCYVQTGYDRFTYEHHDMSMTLRPGEKLVRNWTGGRKFYRYRPEGSERRGGNYYNGHPVRYGDGQIIWKPDLDSKLVHSFFNENQPPAFRVDDGQSPAVHVLNRHGGIYDMATRAIMRTETPYTILGGKLKAKFYRGAATDWDRVSVTVNSRTGPVSRMVWRAPEGAVGFIDAEIDLDDVLYPGGERGRRDYSLEFNFTANEKNDPPTQSGLEEVEMAVDIQVAPNSLPALKKGRNLIRYRDESAGPHNVKITHVWRERTDTHPPVPPRDAVHPPDGRAVKELAPLFRWSAAVDPDKGDRVDNYCIMISWDPQCRWPLATALHKWTGSGRPEWKIDAGWLNPDTMYYWKVMARDNNGVWSDWGPVFSFRTAPDAK